MLICFGQIIGSVDMGFTFLVVYFDQQSCCFELKIEVKAKSRFEQKKFSKSFVFLESYYLQIMQQFIELLQTHYIFFKSWPAFRCLLALRSSTLTLISCIFTFFLCFFINTSYIANTFFNHPVNPIKVNIHFL